MAVAADYNALVQTLYVSYFGRPADTFGLENFANQLAALNAPTELVELNEAAQTDVGLQKLIDSFSGSKEAETLYGTGDTVAFVSAIYQNLLGRSPAFDGLKFWVNAINSGALARGDASLAIAAATTTNETAQGQLDAQRIANKVAVATAFTDAIDTGEELAAYSGQTAAAQARALLSQVTPTTDPAAFQTVVEATLTKLVDIANPGVTVNLGIAADTLIGTSGKDIYNAFSANPVTGTDATTLSSFDNIDGGAGRDTLNIYTKTGINTSQTGTITNVEVVNIFNTEDAAANQFGGGTGVDAGKFVGTTEVWQVAKSNDVVNLGATQTAGFRNTTNETLAVTASGAAASIALDQVSGVTATNILAVTAGGTALSSVSLNGTLIKATAAGADAAATLAITAGTDVTTVSVNTNINTTVSVLDGGSTKKVDTLNAAASTGNVSFTGDAETTTITTGSGNDILSTITATVAAAAGVTAVSAVVNSGAGNDQVTVTTTGSGITTVDAGAGNDTVNIAGRGTGKLTVSLGDGADKFTSTPAINATDVIDAGAGVDTLLLSLVGSANIGAFANFDLFDVVGLGANSLDVDILASKNTVTEFVASGEVGAANAATNATLTNIGANVGFRATADMVASGVVLTQKTGGAITVTVDADETAAADNVVDVANATVEATNATSIAAVFDTSYKAAVAGEPTAGDNATKLTLSGGEAKSITVASGGELSVNTLALGAVAKAESITVTGANALTITGTTQAKLLTIDGSTATGGLTVDTTVLANGGTIKLGTGADTITVGATSVAAGVESVSGFEKTAAAAVGTDAAAATVAQTGTDVLFFGATKGVAEATGVSKGVLSFTGTGPANLGAAIDLALAATDANEVVAFEYVNNTYVVEDGGTVIRLVGVTGVTNLAESTVTADTFFIV